MRKTIDALATIDTKGDELCFVADCIRKAGLDVVLVELSTQVSSDRANISANHIAQTHPAGPENVLGQADRGQAVTAMSPTSPPEA